MAEPSGKDRTSTKNSRIDFTSHRSTDVSTSSLPTHPQAASGHMRACYSARSIRRIGSKAASPPCLSTSLSRARGPRKTPTCSLERWNSLSRAQSSSTAHSHCTDRDRNPGTDCLRSSNVRRGSDVAVRAPRRERRESVLSIDVCGSDSPFLDVCRGEGPARLHHQFRCARQFVDDGGQGEQASSASQREEGRKEGVEERQERSNLVGRPADPVRPRPWIGTDVVFLRLAHLVANWTQDIGRRR